MNSDHEATADSMMPMPGFASLPRRAHPRVAERHVHGQVVTLRPAVADRRPPVEAADAGSAATSQSDATLGRNHFLQQLRREKRRADRTHSPLSVVVYRVPADDQPVDASISALLQIITESVRETDIVGLLGNHSVALLCPDTNDLGANRLMEKIAARANDLMFSAETATYPDHHFDQLTGGEWSPAETHPLFIDEFKKPNRDGYRLKRLLDIIGATIALVLFSPLMLVIAIAVALSSPGPIIFKQRRLGRSGVPFVFYKFRSMRCDTDDAIHRNYVQSFIKGELDKVNQQSNADPMYKIKVDPRVTRLGRFIRKYSIDELPQFFNVLKGDMSLVGPRPPIPFEATNYRSWHLRRVLDVKPGITGLWQVEGRSKVTFDEMVRMDLRYIRNCSMALDLRIMIKTVRVVLSCDGAA